MILRKKEEETKKVEPIVLEIEPDKTDKNDSSSWDSAELNSQDSIVTGFHRKKHIVEYKVSPQ